MFAHLRFDAPGGLPRFLALSLLVAGLSLGGARAFVLDTGSPKGPRHWDLVTPEAHTSPTSFIKVSTNVVNPKTRAVRFFIASDAYSTTNTAAELNAVRASFAQWQAVPGTILKFEAAGLVAPGVDVNENDNTNVVFWAKNGTLVAGGTADIGNALGVTYYSTADDVLVGADIVLNGDLFNGYTWFADFDYVPADRRSQFIEAVLVHEIGHFVGLEHSPLGAATMFAHGAPGVSTQAGLSVDELAAIQFLYPQPGVLAGRGRLQGRVTMNGAGILGAVVVAEDAIGSVAAATVSRTDGSYDLPALLPGDYRLRIAPLDPIGSSFFLVRGPEIINPDFNAAETSFRPTAALSATVFANTTRTLDWSVTAGSPAFRVTGLRKPTTDPNHQTDVNTALSVRPGQSNFIIGVYGPDLPLSGAALAITGDGLTVKAVDSTSLFAGENLVSVILSVSSNATPGLRSFQVTRGNDLAYANGFLEVQPLFPDFNFDGLDDRFQRRYFPLWTAAEAGPSADPDGDGFNNRYEYLAGTDPANAASVPLVRLGPIGFSAQGSTIAWTGVPGGHYQMLTRRGFGTAETWTALGALITATDYSPRFLDARATNSARFYRLQVLP